MSPRPDRTAKRTPCRETKTATKTAVSPINGAEIPLGAHPGNTGGKPGRSGRRPDAFREELAAIRDEMGVPVLREILSGEVIYTFEGRCEHCGKESRGLDATGVVKVTPSPQVRAHALGLTLKYTIPEEKVVTLAGVEDVNRALDLIKERIRSRLAPEQAAALILDIQEGLKSL